MPSRNDVNEQNELLEAHRRTLFHYLKQQAELGKAFAPPGITAGIAEARKNIQRIKDILRGWDIIIEGHPNDLETEDSDKIIIDPFSFRVKELFDTCGYEVSIATDSSLHQLQARKTQGFDRKPVFIKCATKADNHVIIPELQRLRTEKPFALLFFVTEKGVTSQIIEQCISLGIECRTYDQLVDQMINFEPYIQAVLTDPEFTNLKKEYEEPYIQTSQGRLLAWEYLDNWLQNSTSN